MSQIPITTLRTAPPPAPPASGGDVSARSASSAVNAPKPPWLKIKLSNSETFGEVAGLLKDQRLNTVCRSARCPNIGECWGRGTATFMVMGEICTRGCRFCNIATGKPEALDHDEPRRLAEAAATMRLKWVVVTSVDRDDLPDGGAQHFVEVVRELRKAIPGVGIECLVPDFRKKPMAVDVIMQDPPDILNHNIETVPRLYRRIRPGADYQRSLDLLKAFSERGLVTKSGMFVGIGETMQEVYDVLRDLRAHGVRSLTVGQYLRPTTEHAPIARYVEPREFDELAAFAYSIGFDHVASGPLVRSSYKAEEAVARYGLELKAGKVAGRAVLMTNTND